MWWCRFVEWLNDFLLSSVSHNTKIAYLKLRQREYAAEAEEIQKKIDLLKGK